MRFSHRVARGLVPGLVGALACLGTTTAGALDVLPRQVLVEVKFVSVARALDAFGIEFDTRGDFPVTTTAVLDNTVPATVNDFGSRVDVIYDGVMTSLRDTSISLPGGTERGLSREPVFGTEPSRNQVVLSSFLTPTEWEVIAFGFANAPSTDSLISLPESIHGGSGLGDLPYRLVEFRGGTTIPISAPQVIQTNGTIATIVAGHSFPIVGLDAALRFERDDSQQNVLVGGNMTAAVAGPPAPFIEFRGELESIRVVPLPPALPLLGLGLLLVMAAGPLRLRGGLSSLRNPLSGGG